MAKARILALPADFVLSHFFTSPIFTEGGEINVCDYISLEFGIVLELEGILKREPVFFLAGQKLNKKSAVTNFVLIGSIE